jgi:GTPase SAR1 family protein
MFITFLAPRTTHFNSDIESHLSIQFCFFILLNMKIIKICFVGPKACGKSSMIRALLGLPFQEYYESTMSPVIYRLKSQKIIIDLWDCPDWLDQNSTFRGADNCSDAAIVVYCFNLASQENSEACVPYIRELGEKKNVVICGLRSDEQRGPLKHLTNDWHCVTSSNLGVGLSHLRNVLLELCS